MAPKRNHLRAGLLASTALLTGGAGFLSALQTASAQTVLPTHGVVTSGSASLNRSSTNLTINQTTPRAVIDWNSFSIGQGGSVTVVQPNAGSAQLDRVTGSATSTLAGRLTANGQVYLVNPNGIAITRSGAVQVGGGFVASTLGIANSDFNAGNLKFNGNGASAAVSNAGSIVAAPGGLVGLLGGSVSNSGTISVPLGKVGLGSGEQATLDPTGDGFLQVAIPTNATTADGHALVDVSGKVRAAGGSVEIKAATAASAVRNAINLSGIVSASSAHASGGAIVLDGGDGGNVAASGAISASGGKRGGAVGVSGRNVRLNNAKIAARGVTGTGGSVAVTATRAVTLSSALIDASGGAGGGTIAIGGDAHGAGPLANAATTSLDAATVLRADALANGNGGSVTVWSNALTTFAGLITARGGPQGGNGGSTEVSANAATHGVLNYSGLTILTAPMGAAGTLLLDPFDIVISSGTDAGGGFAGGVYTPTATSVINTTTLEAQLAAANVVISTGLISSPGADAGNITVSSPFTWSTGFGLTLTAENAIAINAPITIAGGGQLTLNYSGPLSTGLTFGIGGNVSYAAGAGTGIVGQALTINGNDYTLCYSIAGLQSINGGLGFDALATSITAPTGFAAAPITTYFGTLEGLGNTITGLTINDASTTGVDGLVGVLGNFTGFRGGPFTGTIRDLGLIGANVVAGGSAVGALAGVNNGGFIFNSYATGTVTAGGGGTGDGFGSGGVGGLVGYNFHGTVQNSFSTVAVTGGGAGIGGLVGFNLTGGLVEESYATGAVTGGASGTDVGGLIGSISGGVVQETYSTGAVSGAGGLGGLIGTTTGGTVTNSFWDTQTGFATSAAGTGFATLPLQSIATPGVPLGAFFAGGAAGGEDTVYPYLASFFPNKVQAISGTVFISEGLVSVAAGSGVNGAVTVSADVNGTSLNSATAGVNGYYYIFAPFGTMPSGANVLAYTQANASTGLQNSAAYFVSTGANNASGNTLSGLILFETTPDILYSQLSAGLTNAIGADSGAVAAIAGVTDISISATGASFTVDQAIATSDSLGIATSLAAAPLTIAAPIALSSTGGLFLSTSGGTLTIGGALSTVTGPITLDAPTVLSAPVTTGGGNIAFDEAVTLGANTTVNAGAGTTTFASTVDGGFTLTAGGSVVNFGANVGSITPLAGLTVNGPATLSGNVTTNNGAIAFNGPVTLDANVTLSSGTANTTFAATVDSASEFDVSCSCDISSNFGLTASAGTLSFADALGSNFALGAASLTSTNSMTLPSITAATIFAETTGAAANLTLAPGTVLTASAATGDAVTLEAGLGFINNSGAGAIVLTGLLDPPRWLVYSAAPTDDTFGPPGSFLNSNNPAAWDTPAGGAVAGAGNFYVFAFQPTVTFTSTSASKTYGVATSVASDFTVSGIQPGVAGAFLGDTPATAFSGAPTVTSAGAAATATVAGGPYQITVAAGPPPTGTPPTVTPLNGYALAFVSTGTLTVSPEAITIAATTNTKSYDSTTSAAAAPTVTVGTIFDPATLSETYATPNAGSGLTLTPAVNFANPAAASNYIVTLAPAATGFINPEAITITATTNTKTYDSTTSAAALPTVTVGTIFPADPATSLTETYATANAGTGLTLTPAATFAVPGNYAVTFVPVTTGVINPEAITVTATANTKTYDSTTSAAAAPTVTSGTVFAADPATSLTESYATANAGAGLTLTPAATFANPGNYAVTLVPVATGVINPEAITVTATTNTKTYDGTTSAAAIPTVTSGTVFAADPVTTLTETYATANAGTGLTLTPAATFANPGNYAVTLAPVATGVINPEAITVTATANTKTYDSTISAAAIPTVTSGTILAADPATFMETYSTVNAGKGLTLTPTAIFADANNYAVTFVPVTTGVINPLALTYSVANASSTYGTTATLGAATLTGVLVGDSVTPTVQAFSGGAPIALAPRTPAGAYTEEVTALSNSNYSIAPTGNTNGTLTINPLALTYSVANANSVFGTTPVLGAATLTGVLPGDSVTPTVAAFSGATQLALTPLTPAGFYPEQVTALSNANYAIAATGNTPGTLAIFGSNTTFNPVNPSVFFPPANPIYPVSDTLLPFVPPDTVDPTNLGTTLGGGGAMVFGGYPPVWTVGTSAPGAGGEPIKLAQSGACGGAVNLPNTSRYADPADAVAAISGATEKYIDRCHNPTQKDLADVLDRYAAALAIIAPRLPPQLRNLPNIVSSAAKRVRAAPTRADAVRILKEAVAEVHKEIELVRADDPNVLKQETRIGDLVAGTLDGAASSLERAEGI